MENSYPYKILFVEDDQVIRENYVTYSTFAHRKS